MSAQSGHHASNSAPSGIRTIFVCGASRAYGEVNVVLPLAESVINEGGEAWFLMSSLAAQLTRRRFPNRVFDMSANRRENQLVFWRMVKKYRPDVIVFSELYELLRPFVTHEFPFFNWKLLRDLTQLDATLIFMDFIAQTPLLQSVLDCPQCARKLGEEALYSFLERLSVILPCPLNEPGPVADRRGIPYDVNRHGKNSPVNGNRSKCRPKYLGQPANKDSLLILRASSTWQVNLAESQGLCLYEYLSDLLAHYLEGISRPVLLVSVSDAHKLRAPSNNGILTVLNLPNLPTEEFRDILLSADLIITDNEISYSVAHALGKTPVLVLVNSFTPLELAQRERSDSVIGRLIAAGPGKWGDPVFPHSVYPLPMAAEELETGNGADSSKPDPSGALLPCTTRLGRMPSSPFLRAELYGGSETKETFRRLLLDPTASQALRQQEVSYLQRLGGLSEGAEVLGKIHTATKLRVHTVI
jgi:hypothetical protein